MPPKETTSLLSSSSCDEDDHPTKQQHLRVLGAQESFSNESSRPRRFGKAILVGGVVVITALISLVFITVHRALERHRLADAETHFGNYHLVERQVGASFWDFYDFLDGADSLGSAGYNTYVGPKARAQAMDLIRVEDDGQQSPAIYMQSKQGKTGEPRYAVRLEGKRRYNRGLFILDVDHLPFGCGVWPAFWLTDEDVWPVNGEIDIVEGINTQTVAKTALHTSDRCSMYGHVSPYVKTGVWDTATGIPNTWTGKLDNFTRKEADDCWVNAAHQWANQGCVAESSQNGTIGGPFNENGGGVYVLEWDPANRYIRSWVFGRDAIPANLHDSMQSKSVVPDPNEWDLPYAYFAIGKDTGCSADHFKNMRIVFNLAFCGNVAGNRFARDCPHLAKEFEQINPDTNVTDPILTCNAYMESNPEALEEAYWKIRGVHVYQRK